jgi:D-lactate dehydrogenase
MRIVFFETEGWEPEKLQSLVKEHEVEFCQESLTVANMASFQDADIISPFVHSSLDLAVLSKLPELKYIATRSTGFDHVDLGYCNEHGIVVSNVPVYGTNTVAEHSFALLLAISHHIPAAVAATRQGNFSGTGLRGFDLHGKTLGIIGTGNIGGRVAEIALAFGMQVLACDIKPDAELARNSGLRYVSMESLLAAADCISLHVPGGEATNNLLSEEEFAQMKKGVILINTARGSIVDVRALLRALDSGVVAAAGLDVLRDEAALRALPEAGAAPDNEDILRANRALLDRDNVLITPHSAFNTNEAIERILQTTSDNIEHFIAGSPQNTVNAV